MPNILIADDHKQISSVLTQYAKKDGFTVYNAYDGEETLKIFNEHTFDIILLDVMMPKKDGFEVCRSIRNSSNVPIIMITARGEDFERIMGLDIGADDYIVKPFSPGEVMARVRAILRRIDNSGVDTINDENHFKYDNLSISIENYTASIDNNVLRLTKKELELLWIMSNNKNIVFTREHLLDKIWGIDYYGDARTVDSHIKRLRSKLDNHPHNSWKITTIWGVGYKFEVVEDEI